LRVVLADQGVAFDGATPSERPLGGAESAFVALAEALAHEGADVRAFSRGARTMTRGGVAWAAHDAPYPRCDLYIANRDPKLLGRARAGRTVFWLHNPAQFLAKPRYLLPMIATRPALVFAGPSHRATAPSWLFGLAQHEIPLGVERVFLETPRAPGVPAPRALFTSNPLRGLAPLARLWGEKIHPRAPSAELHVFSGPQVYDVDADEPERAARMRAVLAEAAKQPGVVLRTPVTKAALAAELAQARVQLYLGHPGETFCLAIAEAQAMGVPAVVRPVGAVGERVEEGRTGIVAESDEDFVDGAVGALTDDAAWRDWSAAALAKRPAMGWDRAARAFLALARKSA
jgi:hypothetical protein